ncbi:hypothetical protein ACHAWF_007246 [Thalassiosira exigua]
MLRHWKIDEYEYMKIPLAIFPSRNIEQYGLKRKAKEGFVYVELCKVIYSLPKKGALAEKLLRERPTSAGYYEVKHTPGLCSYVLRRSLFLLEVDNFDVKYVGKEHADHLVAAVKKFYSLTGDREGKLHCGIKLNWNYDQRWVDFGMPGYVKKGLQKYAQSLPQQLQYSPVPAVPRRYGKAA